MQRVKTLKTLTRAVSAALFLSVQALICIGTVYWAIAETLGMAGTAALVLAALFAVPSVYILILAVRMAYDAETDAANQ
jgi:asparagine N-glycosylation enzyme membrane subunit Stt3